MSSYYFLYSSHPKKPAPQPILWDITGRTGLGLVNRRMQGGLLSVALLFSYMSDTHGDLPRCLFPGFGLGVYVGLPKGLVYTLPHDKAWVQSLGNKRMLAGVTECHPTTFL